MNEAAVNAWLTHWVARQGRGKLPLVLTQPSNASVLKGVPTGSSKKGKKRMEWVEPDSEVGGEGEEHGGSDRDGSQISPDVAEATGNPRSSFPPSGTVSEALPDGPSAPGNFAETRKSRRGFLEELSEDGDYRRLLLLLDRAKVLLSITSPSYYILILLQQGTLSCLPPLAWASWKSMSSYLPPGFHSMGGKESFSALVTWLSSNPVTARNMSLASHQTIEIVALSIGLAMCDISGIQFVDDAILPSHVVNSPLQFRQYETLAHCTQNLLTGWEDMYVAWGPLESRRVMLSIAL